MINKHDQDQEDSDLEHIKTNHPITNARLDNSDNVSSTAALNASKKVEWSPENELIMVEWCDVAQCYKWMNTKAHQRFSYMHAWFTIPAITLSTISGTASFAQTSLPAQYQALAPMAIGTINIFIGILTTVQQYLKISELNEAHRVSAISWDKFARNIRIELAKNPEERMDAGQFLKLSRQEFDRLMETSPMIPENIIKEFNTKFSGRAGSIERKRFEELKKPDICNIIVSANETRHHWYLDIGKSADEFDKSADEAYAKSKDELIRNQQRKIAEKDKEIRRKELEDQEKLRRQIEDRERSVKATLELELSYKTTIQPIRDYVAKFENMYSRRPMKYEIQDNFKEEVDADVLARFLNTYDEKESIGDVLNNV